MKIGTYIFSMINLAMWLQLAHGRPRNRGVRRTIEYHPCSSMNLAGETISVSHLFEPVPQDLHHSRAIRRITDDVNNLLIKSVYLEAKYVEERMTPSNLRVLNIIDDIVRIPSQDFADIYEMEVCLQEESAKMAVWTRAFYFMLRNEAWLSRDIKMAVSTPELISSIDEQFKDGLWCHIHSLSSETGTEPVLIRSLNFEETMSTLVDEEILNYVGSFSGRLKRHLQNYVLIKEFGKYLKEVLPTIEGCFALE